MVKTLGADKVIDYNNTNLDAIGEYYDIVFVAVDKIAYSNCKKMLKPYGCYVNISLPLPSIQMLHTKIRSNKTIILGENSPETAKDLNFVQELVEAGQLKPVMDRSYPMGHIVAAHQYEDQGHKKGNVTIRIIEEV